MRAAGAVLHHFPDHAHHLQALPHGASVLPCHRSVAVAWGSVLLLVGVALLVWFVCPHRLVRRAVDAALPFALAVCTFAVCTFTDRICTDVRCRVLIQSQDGENNFETLSLSTLTIIAILLPVRGCPPLPAHVLPPCVSVGSFGSVESAALLLSSAWPRVMSFFALSLARSIPMLALFSV